jgi:nitrite reductase (NADH) small subunit
MSASTMEMFRLGPVGSIPPGEGRNFRVEGRAIAVFRTRSGEVYATQAECPHRGAPLADGLLGGGRIVCPFHSYAFDLNTGEPVMNSCPALKTFRVMVNDSGDIYASLEEDPDRQSCMR